MANTIREVITGILIALLAFIKPLEAELWTLFMIFFTNFLFGYLSDMIANNAEWDNKKAIRCVGEAALFYALCLVVFVTGKLKGQEEGALQCVSFITYVIIYFYGLNVLRNCKKIFIEETTPWYVVSFLYYVLRFKFIEKIPFLKDFLSIKEPHKDV